MRFLRFMLISIAFASLSLKSESSHTTSHSIEMRAGINPTLFSNPGSLYEIVENINPQEGRLDTKVDSFTFQNMFSTPWIIALQFNWCNSPCHKTFIELNYTRAHGKKVIEESQVRNQTGTEIPFRAEFTFDDFSMFGAYIGHRRYWNLCKNLFFHGSGKVGIGHYQDIDMRTERTEPVNPILNIKQTAYQKDIVISGGLQLGCSYAFQKPIAIMIQVEVLGNGSLKNTIDQFILNPNDSLVGGSNFIIEKTGTLVSFPITFGLSCNW